LFTEDELRCIPSKAKKYLLIEVFMVSMYEIGGELKNLSKKVL